MVAEIMAFGVMILFCGISWRCGRFMVGEEGSRNNCYQTCDAMGVSHYWKRTAASFVMILLRNFIEFC